MSTCDHCGRRRSICAAKRSRGTPFRAVETDAYRRARRATSPHALCRPGERATHYKRGRPHSALGDVPERTSPGVPPGKSRHASHLALGARRAGITSTHSTTPRSALDQGRPRVCLPEVSLLAICCTPFSRFRNFLGKSPLRAAVEGSLCSRYAGPGMPARCGWFARNRTFARH